MCHYEKLTFPEPAVIVALLYPPLAVLSVPVTPAPNEIVTVSGYLRITTPEPPVPPEVPP
jgi:hypothetical protein